MSKRKRSINVDKMIKLGKGTGLGSEYKPWITIQDVPSLGRSTRLRGIKTGRQHEFLSDLERNYFYFLEYSKEVVDIREQYPLMPLEETIMIAEELGIEHPKHPETGEYIVMTTDFLITKKFNNELIEIARTIKIKDELLNKRVLEKFQIEKTYWDRRDTDWGIVTEIEINKDMARNLSYVHSYYDIREIDSFKDIEAEELEDLILEYIRRVIDTRETIRKVSSSFDKDMSLANGSGISIFRYLLARRIIEVNLSKTLNIDESIDINLVNKDLNLELNIL